MKYYKIENGTKTYAGSSIIFEDKQVINPTAEILLAAGYTAESEELTEAQKLQQAIDNKIAEIDVYDNSDAVNSFTYNNIPLWFSAEVRAGFKNSIESASLLGETTISIPTTAGIINLSLNDAKIILAKIQRYADACYITTLQHKQEVSKLTSIENINAYDITVGYPTKLSF